MLRFLFCTLLLAGLSGRCQSRITANCVYDYQPESATGPYECVFSSRPFKNEQDVTSIIGTHFDGFDDDNVTTVRVPRSTVMPTAPTILCEKFKNLRFIIMSFVYLQQITDNSFSLCVKLEYILLTQNRLREITANVFEKNVELRTLLLSDNPSLVRIEKNPFRNLGKLNSLELHRSQIEGINEETFQGLSNVTSLTLFTNRIPELPLNSFRDLLSLRTLQLFNNQISKVHPDFLDSLPDTQIDFTLWNNPCISQGFTFTKETLDEIKPLFRECFDNYFN